MREAEATILACAKEVGVPLLDIDGITVLRHDKEDMLMIAWKTPFGVRWWGITKDMWECPEELTRTMRIAYEATQKRQ